MEWYQKLVKNAPIMTPMLIVWSSPPRWCIFKSSSAYIYHSMLCQSHIWSCTCTMCCNFLK